MKFDKEHLVDIETLTRAEAIVFIGFLLFERERHLDTAEDCNTWMELWHSELDRQIEEVRHIDEGLQEVNKKFGWEEK